jgi:uncharacterized protein YggE
MKPLPSTLSLIIVTMALLISTEAAAGTDTANRDIEHSSRLISVTGQAEKEIPPNLARITVAVEQRGMALDTVRRQVNETVSRILRAIETLRLSRSDVQSSGITIRPEFTYERSGTRRFEGYVVNREINITLRDLAVLGSVIERSLDAGANQISDPIFDHSDRAQLERSVLSAATQAARLNAIAAAAGVEMEVGAPLKIIVQDHSATPRVTSLRMAAMDTGTPEASYQPGMLNFRVIVNAEFELTPASR